MLDMVTRLLGAMERYQNYVLPLGILVALAICFMGYKYLKAWVAALGFFMGFGGGYVIAYKLVDDRVYAPLLVGLMAGIILTLISFMVFKAGIFVFCAMIAGSLVWGLPLMESLSEKVRYMELPGTMAVKMAVVLPVLITIVAAVVIGIAGLKLTRPVVIFSTGICGAFRAVMYLMVFLDIEIVAETRFVWLGVIVLLAILGIVVQHFTAGK